MLYSPCLFSTSRSIYKVAGRDRVQHPEDGCSIRKFVALEDVDLLLESSLDTAALAQFVGDKASSQEKRADDSGDNSERSDGSKRRQRTGFDENETDEPGDEQPEGDAAPAKHLAGIWIRDTASQRFKRFAKGSWPIRPTTSGIGITHR